VGERERFSYEGQNRLEEQFKNRVGVEPNALNMIREPPGQPAARRRVQLTRETSEHDTRSRAETKGGRPPFFAPKKEDLKFWDRGRDKEKRLLE